MDTKQKVVRRLLGDDNPMHSCLGCGEYLGFRGFCSQKCHDEYYDAYDKGVIRELARQDVKRFYKKNKKLIDSLG